MEKYELEDVFIDDDLGEMKDFMLELIYRYITIDDDLGEMKDFMFELIYRYITSDNYNFEHAREMSDKYCMVWNVSPEELKKSLIERTFRDIQ